MSKKKIKAGKSFVSAKELLYSKIAVDLEAEKSLFDELGIRRID
jgi:hypothetical protein